MKRHVVIYNSSHECSLTRDFSGNAAEFNRDCFRFHLWLWIKIIFLFSTVICDACKIATGYIRCGISTCMPNSQHEFSSSCFCVDRFYRSKFGAKDRPAGVNNLHIVRFSLSVCHLNTNEPFSTIRFQRTKGVKRNRGICYLPFTACRKSYDDGSRTKWFYIYRTESLFYIR